MLRIILITASIFIVLCLPAISAVDTKLLPISKEDLIKRIQRTPIQSPEHSELISRAYVSHLAGEAYAQYTALWRKQPNNAFTNLRRGVAAAEYWQYATNPSVNELPLSSPQADSVEQSASSCLAKAVELAPKSALTSAQYGHFLFYKGYMDKGVTLMKTATALDDKMPVVHELLGEVYSSPNPPYYSPKKAEDELRTAIRLAPSDSYPHWILARLYVMTNRYQQAQREMQAYLNMAPTTVAQESWVKRIQTRIAAGLSKG